MKTEYQNELLTHAVAYIEKGWRVFPVHGIKDNQCTCGKIDCKHAGKHPLTHGKFQEGFKDATLDLSAIKSCIEKHPNMNIGAPTGKENGLFVVDIDNNEAKGKFGFTSLDAYESINGKLPDTLTVKTGGGGLHHLFKYPTTGSVKSNNNGAFAKHIDIKGDGGYIVLAPSRHISGGSYELQDVFAEEGLPELADYTPILKAGNKISNTVTNSKSEWENSTQSERNDLLNALKHCPNENYDDWLFVGMALHHHFNASKEGFEVWANWSSSCGSFDSQTTFEKWQSCGDAERPKTKRYIFQIAYANGYKNAPPSPDYKSILDDEKHYCSVDLLQHVADSHLLKKLSLSIANATDLPQSTVFLMGLGVFSSVACRKWSVTYPDGIPLPIGLYVVAEQPSGTAKSRCLKVFQTPFYDAKAEIKKDILQKLKELKTDKKQAVTPDKEESGNLVGVINEPDAEEEIERLQRALGISLFTTNATPEALDASLCFSRGFFSAVASEQGLINSLLGLAYGKDGGKANNNDLLLNAFNGDYVNSKRVTRDGYEGNVMGGFVLFAQRGSVETILNQSNGTGISERFLMLAEKDNLGFRDFLKEKIIDKSLIEEYAEICDTFASDIFLKSNEFNFLDKLSIDAEGWRMINQYRNRIEPELKAGGRFSHASLVGAVGKVDMQIMKIAANLHIIQSTPHTPAVIDNTTISSAINIVNDLMEAHLAMLKDKGAIGAKAEYSAIIGYLTKKPKATLSELKNSLKRTQPFKSASGSKAAAIETAIDEMVDLKGLVLLDGFYSIAKG
jgi:hypothetical protein